MGRGKFIWRRKLIALRKLFALVLCFSFILTPLEVAFAQDAGTGTAATDSGSSTPPPTPPPTPTPPPSPDFSIPGVDATPPSPDGSASCSAPSTDASPATEPVTTSPTDASTPSDSTQSPSTTPPPAPLSPSGFGSDGSPTSLNPNVFTAQNTAPKADGATGALTQTIPLDIPPGRNGVQPDLALKYNSQNTEDGIAGYGWTVSIPYIQRLNKIGSQSLYNAPYFTSSIDGELATTSSATTTMTFDAKVDDGSFNSYSFANNVWTMYDKNGTRYTFGASDNAQQNASASSTQIYKWMLQEIRDTNNNYVRYTYFKDSGQIYPMQIYYTGNGGTDGTFQVTFAVASRGDVYINYTPGFKVTTNYRVAQIEVRSNGNEVRRYYLSYTTGKNVLRSLLSGVQEIGWDANHANQVSYPALSLGYVSSSAAFAGPHGAAGQAYITGDANGDGLNDVMVSYTLIGGGQTAAVNGTTVSAPEYWGSQENVCPNPYPSERGVRVLDTNADGKMDIFRAEYNYTTGVSILDAAMNTYSTSTGYGWSGVATDSVPYFDNDGSGSVYHVTSGIFGDVNGDGLPDYEEAVSGLGAPFGDYAYLGNGFEWGAATTTIFAPKREMPTGTATYDNSQLVDINGDGLSDWVYSDSSQTYVVLNTGTGWESSPSSQWTLSTSTLYTNYSDRGMRFIDINGDGLPDFVRSYSMGHPNAGFGGGYEEGTYQVVFLNTGLGWATSTAYTLAPIATIRMDSGVALGECYDEYANMTGNGQNAQDVLSTITYPQGGSATVSYVKTAQSGNPELPYSLLVVSSIISNDGFGNTVEKDYSYTGGKQYTALGVRNRKFAGFANSTESDANTLTTTYYDQGDTINTSLGEQNDGYGQINHPFRIDVAKKSNGQLMRQTFDRWDATSTFIGNTTFVQLARQVVQDYGPSGDHRDTATDYTYSTSTGNVTQIARYGEVAGNSDGTFSDINNDGSVTTNTYAHSTSTILNVLIEKGTGPAIFASSSTSTLWTLANVLVVGGGGGGGAGFNNGRGGGAGGGGGVDLDPVHPVSIQSYSITVGAGGAGSTDSNFAGSSGSNSVFDTITAYGGGGGGSDWQGPSSGGSGGGGDASGSSGGSGTVGQGYAGGTKASGDSGAGGGGATQIGQVTTTGVGGAGGTGYTTSISGTSATYGGGGGGGGHDGGGGGGGKWYNGGTTGPGGTGGLGIVIIAAPIGVVTSASGGTHTTANGNDIWKFTSSGTWTINSLAPTNSTSTVMTATSSDTRLYYDSLPFGQVSLGDNTKQENWIAGSTYASTTRAYDGTYGLVTGSTDADGNLSTSTLDINHLYAATTTNPFFQATGYTYDY